MPEMSRRSPQRSAATTNERFAFMAQLLLELPARSAVLGGEIVANDPDGRPNFARLQLRSRESQPAHFGRSSLEGVVSKRRDAPYRSGERRDWRKVKTAAWLEVNRERWRLFEIKKAGTPQRDLPSR